MSDGDGADMVVWRVEESEGLDKILFTGGVEVGVY